MTVIFIIAAICLIGFFLKNFISGNKAADDNSRPSDDQLPSVEKDNDKIIMVTNVTQDEIKSTLTKFCNLYNKENFVALPRLWQLSPNKYAVTFPYDIDFQTYCFAVNFLKYPMDIKWQSKVYAWATANERDEWITEKSAGKKVMLFLADDDKEYDNVFLTTEDNIGYKLGFALGQQKKLLPAPKDQYVSPTVLAANLTGAKFEDFK